ncbi:MAG TPA: hypothetical protein VMO00_17365 [Methylomirabilota bacterium]|nr:hypothetical protein [Methylomirabilota bacterium]
MMLFTNRWFWKSSKPRDCAPYDLWVSSQDAGAVTPARAPGISGGPSALQPGRLASPPAVPAVRGIFERCALDGHVVKTFPWQEIPGHWENWGRAVRCDCGAVAHFQVCHHHENPGRAFPDESV